MDPVVVTRGLVKRYGDLTALDGVDLEVPASCAFAVVGPNGAGKTTLIHVLTTLLVPTAGTARVCGYDVVREARAVRACIGVAFQESSVDLDFTGREVLDFHARLLGIPAARRRQRIDELADALDLAGVLGRWVRTYSGGTRRRLELARALLGRPALVVLDEPTGALDPHNRERLWELIRRLVSEDGTTVLFTTHYLEEAERLADRVAIIDRGRVLAEGSPADLVGQMGEEVIYVEGDGPLAELGRRVADQLGDARWWARDGMLQLSVSRAGPALPKVAEAAREASVRLRNLTVSRPSLHDVFIRLTGRRVRD